ncbi:hypothetical protein [Sphingomonas sp.]|uniref:hypothetical protein n=1 Tax=Sphingomonas sp. TaxID=28214 RepID=UPI0025ED9F19|nr:hypothetical protein [Sphingomonas sp.]
MIRADPRQFDMFAAIAPTRAPAIVRRVDPNGPVIQGKIDEVLMLPHPHLRWARARIELHRHTDGLWMWATGYHDDGGSGGGYRVGAKWGNFAKTRDDALFYACEEIRERATGDSKALAAIRRWLDDLATISARKHEEGRVD